MNMGLLNKVVIFAVGAAVGSAITYVVTRRKYEQPWEYEEETSEPAEENSKSDEEENSDKTEEELNKEEMVQYNRFVKKYSGNSDEVEKEEKEEEDVEKPYLISVDEYAELDEYETNSLYYYEDKVLTDEMGNPFDEDEVDDIVGLENLKKFDDPDVDSIYIRNDAKMSDYEVLRDIGNFYEYKK